MTLSVFLLLTLATSVGSFLGNFVLIGYIGFLVARREKAIAEEQQKFAEAMKEALEAEMERSREYIRMES
jgi:Flp pilus assembly protein TadB